MVARFLTLAALGLVAAAPASAAPAIHAHRGGTLRLASISRRVQELLLITRLGQIFDSYETDAEAIASLVPGH